MVRHLFWEQDDVSSILTAPRFWLVSSVHSERGVVYTKVAGEKPARAANLEALGHHA